MIITTKKRGEIEVGNDREVENALSKVFGPILDEMLDMQVQETTAWLSVNVANNQIDIVIAVGQGEIEEDFKRIPLEELIKEEVNECDEVRDFFRNKLIEIARWL